jgi:hypothetical protein
MDSGMGIEDWRRQTYSAISGGISPFVSASVKRNFEEEVRGPSRQIVLEIDDGQWY